MSAFTIHPLPHLKNNIVHKQNYVLALQDFTRYSFSSFQCRENGNKGTLKRNSVCLAPAPQTHRGRGRAKQTPDSELLLCLMYHHHSLRIRGVDVCVDPSPTLFSGTTQEWKTAMTGFWKSITRSKSGFKFLFSKLHCSLRVSLYFLASSWQNNQLLAGIVFSWVSLFIFVYAQDHLCISVTFYRGTWKLPMPLPHQCSSQCGHDWSLDNFLCLPYSNPLFLSILGTGQSLWKKVLD